jgi:hypothetical protein
MTKGRRAGTEGRENFPEGLIEPPTHTGDFKEPKDDGQLHFTVFGPQNRFPHENRIN